MVFVVWRAQHVLIPVLPLSMAHVLSSPLPFLIGFPGETALAERQLDVGDGALTVLDLDRRALVRVSGSMAEDARCLCPV